MIIFQPTRKVVETEVEVTEIFKERASSPVFYVDGILCRFDFRRDPTDDLTDDPYIDICFVCNLNDSSEWWQVRASIELVVLNGKRPYKAFYVDYYSQANFEKVFMPIRWSELKTCEKCGRIAIKATVDILGKYGFDEKTGRGIEKPMKK
uniref:Conserved protein n=1 Tax=Caenorhabditis tropicalis TaxID=1561998 RepID=A0A1I7T9Y7_9PELO